MLVGAFTDQAHNLILLANDEARMLRSECCCCERIMFAGLEWRGWCSIALSFGGGSPLRRVSDGLWMARRRGSAPSPAGQPTRVRSPDDPEVARSGLQPVKRQVDITRGRLGRPSLADLLDLARCRQLTDGQLIRARRYLPTKARRFVARLSVCSGGGGGRPPPRTLEVSVRGRGVPGCPRSGRRSGRAGLARGAPGSLERSESSRPTG